MPCSWTRRPPKRVSTNAIASSTTASRRPGSPFLVISQRGGRRRTGPPGLARRALSPAAPGPLSPRRPAPQSPPRPAPFWRGEAPAERGPPARASPGRPASGRWLPEREKAVPRGAAAAGLSLGGPLLAEPSRGAGEPLPPGPLPGLDSPGRDVAGRGPRGPRGGPPARVMGRAQGRRCRLPPRCRHRSRSGRCSG